LDAHPPAVLQTALLEAHARAFELAAGFATRSSLALVESEWRIVRSDGTDVQFCLPRAIARHGFTARGGSQAASTGVTVSGADDRVLLEPPNLRRLARRASQALARLRAVVDAPPVRSG